MVMVLREVLDHPLIRDAEPVVLSGEHRMEDSVRWIHSADLYDIAPLLRGGEVLLTNGVGLVGVDEPGRRVYVRRLAQRGVAALFFETGRTFTEIPGEMIDEARRLDLPLVVLQPVLRFTEVAESINSMVIDRSVVRLRHADEISRMLSETLARGGTLAEIVDRIAKAVGTWAELRDSQDRVTASGGTPPDDQESAELAEVPILIDGTSWGRLSIGSDGASELMIDAVLERAPTVIELSLIRQEPNVTGPLRLRHLLLQQLARGAQAESHVLKDRLRAAGLPVSGHDYVCVVADPGGLPNAATVLDQIVGRLGQGIFGLAEGVLCAVIAARAGAGASTLGEAAESAVREVLPVRTEPWAAVGRTVQAIPDLPRSMAETRLSLTIAAEIRPETPMVTAQSLAVERLLVHYGDLGELRLFVNEQLGPLLDTDGERSAELIETLKAMVACGWSKTAAAERLHLRRQSLYYRLRQIAKLLDTNLDDPAQMAAISVALSALRMLGSNLMSRG